MRNVGDQKPSLLYVEIKAYSVDRVIDRPYFFSNHLWIAVIGIPFICKSIVCNIYISTYILFFWSLTDATGMSNSHQVRWHISTKTIYCWLIIRPIFVKIRYAFWNFSKVHLLTVLMKFIRIFVNPDIFQNSINFL